jgi:hypothetical protein
MSDFFDAVEKSGLVTGPDPVPVSSLPEDLQAQLCRELESGELSLSTGEDDIPPWTEEEKQTFVRVMQRALAEAHKEGRL